MFRNHNFDHLDDRQLTELSQAIKAEQDKRARRAEAERKADEAVHEYQTTIDRKPGDPWQQPTSYLDAYTAGEVVTRDERTFTSNINGNTLDPLVSGWTEQLPEGEYRVWKPPLGYQDAYPPGVIVWHPEKDTDLYRNDHHEGNAWEPGTPHSQWTLLDPEELEEEEPEEPPVEEPEPDPEPEPEEPPTDDGEDEEPEPEPEPTPEPPIEDEPTDPEPEENYPVWQQPTGWQDAYDPGKIVWHPTEGANLYRNDHTAGNAWEPGTPHSQWTLLEGEDQ